MTVPVVTAVLLGLPLARAETTLLEPEGVVSLLMTFPVGLVPAVPFAIPPASIAVAVSVTALGSVALDPYTVIVKFAADVAPEASLTVYGKTSTPVAPAFKLPLLVIGV